MYLESNFSTFLSGCVIITTLNIFWFVCVVYMCSVCVSWKLCVRRPRRMYSVLYKFQQAPGTPLLSTLSSIGVAAYAWAHMALNTIWRICTSPHTYTANAPTHWAIFPAPKFYFNCSRWWGMKSHFGVFLVSREINHFFIGSESIYTVKAVVWSMFNCTVNILRIDLWLHNFML